MKKTIVTSVMMLLVLSTTVLADSLAKRWGVGVNYPGVSVKYGISKNHAVEIKSQFGEDIFVIGPRYYYNFNPQDKVVLYIGGEVDYLTFEGESSDGSGFVGGIFVGGEYFINAKFGIGLDFGPVYVNIEDEETSLYEEGIDYIVNISLSYYFGGGKGE
ncbi:MAG: hypothetical protein KAJ14_06365 [Candidatus Omnitrophica bacterium]|nr:hypothetical protein [Candidatus Omnitrophota bacterium]